MTKGSAFSMAQWYTHAEEANEPEDEVAREEILSKCYKFQRFGVHKDTVILDLGPEGRVLIDIQTNQGCKICYFDYVPRGRWVHTKFWFNASSVADLGEALRKSPEKRVSFMEIFVN